MKPSKTLHYRKQRILTTSIALLFIVIVASTSIADEKGNDELKITISNDMRSYGFQQEIEINPLPTDIIETLSTLDYITYIIPTINKIYMSLPDIIPDFPQNGTIHDPSTRPGPGQYPPDFNGSFLEDPNNNFRDQNPNDNFKDKMSDYIIEGIPLEIMDEYLSSLLSLEIESGRLFNENDTSVVVLGKSAQTYFNINLQESITIENQTFTVIGLFDNETYNKYVFMSIEDAQTLYGLSSDEITTIYLYAENESYIEDIISNISDMYSDLQVRTNQFFGSNPFYNNSFPPQNRDSPFNSLNTNNTPGFEVILIVMSVVFIIIQKKWKSK